MTIPEHLADYLAERDRQRAQQVSDTLAALTPREQALVREAAVMGFVRGVQTLGTTNMPTDAEILADVIASCLTWPDLYPTIARGGGV